MPASSRPAFPSLRAACRGACKSDARQEKDIEQRVEWINEKDKKQRLQSLLAVVEPPIIIFVNQKKAGDVLVKALNSDGYNAVSIHGGKQQEVREESLTAFKEGQVIASFSLGRVHRFISSEHSNVGMLRCVLPSSAFSKAGIT